MALQAKKPGGHRSRTTDEAIEEATREPEKAVVFNVPESLHRRFKATASSRGEKMKDVLIAAIREYVKQ